MLSMETPFYFPKATARRIQALAKKTGVNPNTIATHLCLEGLPELEKQNGIRRARKPRMD